MVERFDVGANNENSQPLGFFGSSQQIVTNSLKQSNQKSPGAPSC